MPAERPKVLIVDDQPRNLDALEAMLAPSECELIRAQTPDEALLALLEHDFAAIVLDIRMPGMTGIELAELIKARKRSQHIPILFLTAHSADDSEVLRGYGVGAVDYLSKPVNADVLRSKIEVFTDLFRKTRALATLNEALQREVGERERAQAALEHANHVLEARVEERTEALIQAHRGVRENAERLLMAMDVAQMTAWECDLATGARTWATDPEVLLGFPAGAFGPDRQIAQVLHDDDRDRVDGCLRDALHSGTHDCGYRVVRPDGSVVWLTERGRVLSQDGQSSRMVGVTRDVTAEQEAARERETLLRLASEARDEAERQVRLKDEFLATLTHELRTPMNAVLGWLAILLQGDALTEDTRRIVGIVERNAIVQARLIDDLLEMTRLMTGNIHLEMTEVDLGGLLELTMQAIWPTAHAKQVQIAVDEAAPACVVVGDARRLQQVFWNLLQNAVKFTPTGGRIHVQVHVGAAAVTVGVTDTGRGITPAFLPHVFERFRQEDPSTTREASGLGLGLSIARHLVELHGGQIQALSEGQGTGSTFRVQLPRLTSGVSADALPATAAARPSS